MTQHLTSLLDIDQTQLQRVVALAAQVKKNPKDYRHKLDDKSVAVIFAKQSTRTRVSFEVGLHQLGAQALILASSGSSGMQMGRGETVHDTAKVMSRFVDAIVIRTYAQADIQGLAEHGSVPVVNALTDAYHPCQALADVQTMHEKFGPELKGRKLVYVGAGNNVTHSLMLAGPRAGFDVVAACPASLAPDAEVLRRAQADAEKYGTSVQVEHDLEKAVAGADVIYTDTWISMGQDDQAKELLQKLEGYQVNKALLDKAGDEVIFMHCLPAHRGEEVTDAVMDGPRSVVFDQAENRLHAQKALMLLLLEAEPW